MNKSIESVKSATNNEKVRTYCDILTWNADKTFTATFIKKNGEERELTFKPSIDLYELIGKKALGNNLSALETKTLNDIITVTEIVSVEDGVNLRLRSVNLATITSLKFAA